MRLKRIKNINMSSRLMLILLFALFTAMPGQLIASKYSDTDTLANSNGFIENSITITGETFDINKKPVSNVYISFEGLRVEPVFTNENGFFTVRIPHGDTWLLASPTGNLQPKRVYLSGRKHVVLYLSPDDVSTGSDIVQTGFTEKRKRDISATVTAANVSNTETTNATSALQLLQGKISGLEITNNSGMPGSGSYAILRGPKSIFANNQPLYVVDGMPLENANIFDGIIDGQGFSPLANLEPYDISSITVLKDAAATSMYGIKGANGVIIIETLQPTELTTTIYLNIRTGVYLSPNEIPLLDNRQYRSYANDVLLTSPVLEENYRELYPGLFDDKTLDSYYRYHNQYGALNNTNWQDQIFQNSIFNDISFIVKGGDDVAKYGLSVGYLTHEGTVKNTNFDRANIRFVADFNIYSWLKLNTTSNLNFSNSNVMNTGWNHETSPILTSLFKTPLFYPTLRNAETGIDLPAFLDDYDNFGVSNPSAVIAGFEGILNTYRIMSSARFDAKITDNFSAAAFIGLNFYNSRERTFSPNIGMVEYYDGDIWSVAKNQTSMLKNYYGNFSLKYDKKLNSTSLFSAIGGFRFQTNKIEQDFAVGKNLPVNDQYTSVSRADRTLSEIGGNTGAWNWLAFYANAQYSLLDKYLINATVSTDGSSRVGGTANTGFKLFNHPFGVFPSVGAAWRVSNENFLRDIAWIEELKIRASYGLTGNDDIGNYNSYIYFEPMVYRGTTGLVLGSLPNTDLKFETNYQSNIGIDLSLLGERVNLTADYFRILTTDMLVFEKQETYLGYDFRTTNGGEAENRGFEFALNSRVIQSKNFNWDFGFNIATYKNTLKSLKGGSLENGIFISYVGESINNYYGYVAEGVYSTTQEARAAGLVNERFVSYSAGDMKYKNIYDEPNNKNVIDRYDKTIIGSPNPDYFGGLTNNLRYKNLSLNVFFQFAVGHEIYNAVRRELEGMSNLYNQSAATLDRFIYEGQQTNMPRAYFGDPIGNTDFSTRWIEDGSYLRLKTLTLAYTLPEGIRLNANSDKKFLRSVKFYVTATNLLTFTRYLGYDPEFSYGPGLFNQGIDYGQMPQVKSFMLGVKIGL
jgi:TonB-linked SusC/RagA family outer membrane protein